MDDLAGDELLDAGAGDEEVRNGVAVAHQPGARLDQADREQDAGPEPQLAAVLARNALVQGAAEGEGEDRLGAHPGHTEDGGDSQRRGLLARDPDEETASRAQVGDAWVVQGE